MDFRRWWFGQEGVRKSGSDEVYGISSRCAAGIAFQLRQIAADYEGEGEGGEGAEERRAEEDTTTVHAPIRKDALLQAGNVAQRLPIVRQIQALGSTRGQHVWFDQKGRFGSRK